MNIIESNSMIAKYMVNAERLKIEIENKRKERDIIKMEWEQNKEGIKMIENNIDMIKRKTTFIKEVLIKYYKNLLLQGTDTR